MVTLNRNPPLHIQEMDLSENAGIESSMGSRYTVDDSMVAFWLVRSQGQEITLTFGMSQSLNDYDPVTNTSGTVDADCFDVVTDVQFIAYGRFQPDGSIQKEEAADNLEHLKSMIGECDVHIFNGYSMAEMLRTNMERAVLSVTEYVLKSGVDGVDFDWEYPANSEEHRSADYQLP